VPLVEFMELLIPCISHLENRVGEKILAMILRKGMELWSGAHWKNYFEDINSWVHQLHQHIGLYPMREGMTKS
jgi:hypothetical protein